MNEQYVSVLTLEKKNILLVRIMKDTENFALNVSWFN